jgi:hypothetical protein
MEYMFDFFEHDKIFLERYENFLKTEPLEKLQRIFLQSLREKNFFITKSCIKYLPTINYGNTVNSVCSDKINPLCCCAYEGNMASVKFLVENGADVNYIIDTKKSAIMFAFEKKHIEIVKFLYNNNAKIKIGEIKITDFFPGSFYGEQFKMYSNLLNFVDDKINIQNEK